MPATIDIRVPDLGDFNEVPVIELAVGPGDTVVEGDTVIVLESDKATLDVPAEVAGKIVALKVEEGSIVSTGTAIATLEPAAEPSAAEAPAASPVPSTEAASPGPAATASAVSSSAAASSPAPMPAPQTAPTASATMAPATLPMPDHRPGKPVHASPSVRRFARVLGAAIEEVSGTGPKGRITREDVEGYVKAKLTAPDAAPRHESSAAMAGLPPWPQVDHAKFGTVERIPLSRIKMLSGPALARNAMVIPHVTNFEKADVTDLEAFRKSINAQADGETAKLTMLAFAVKAAVSALQAFPVFNASLDGDGLILKHYFNIGVAADTPEGLVVPVVKDADKKGLLAIAKEMKALAGAAREGKLKSADIQGATFTISSLGGIGGTNFTPIINAPEVAILGMPRSDIQPVWDGSAFAPRLIQPLALSFDHRVADGVAAARFLVYVAEVLGDLRRLSL